jgi:hypothetical protein
MINLNAEQKACVGSWVEEGMGLSDIQKRLKADFDIGLTFMDVRFLVSDLRLQLKSEDKKKPELDDMESDSHDTVQSDGDFDNPDTLGDEGSGGVTVEIDKVVRPGAAASGSVTFSDGKKAGWHVISMVNWVLSRLWRATNLRRKTCRPSRWNYAMQCNVRRFNLPRKKRGFLVPV